MCIKSCIEDAWALTCVCFHVLVKVLFHVEVFAAPLAHELLVSDVNAHMRAQLVLVLEPFIAVLQHKEETLPSDTKKMERFSKKTLSVTFLFTFFFFSFLNFCVMCSRFLFILACEVFRMN